MSITPYRHSTGMVGGTGFSEMNLVPNYEVMVIYSISMSPILSADKTKVSVFFLGTGLQI